MSNLKQLEKETQGKFSKQLEKEFQNPEPLIIIPEYQAQGALIVKNLHAYVRYNDIYWIEIDRPNITETKQEYVDRVGRIWKEKGLDDFIEQNPEVNTEQFRDWIRNQVAYGFLDMVDSEDIADRIINHATQLLQTTIFIEK